MCSPQLVVFAACAIRETRMVLYSCGYLNVRVCSQNAVPAGLLLRYCYQA